MNGEQDQLREHRTTMVSEDLPHGPPGPHLRAYLESPPEDSAARRAIAFGTDLSLTWRRMWYTSPDERMHELLERVRASRPRMPRS